MLSVNTTLEEGVTLSELVHALYGMNKFIVDYFCEEYEVARSFAISTRLDRNMSNITFYKSFRVESDDFLDDDEYVYIIPEIRIQDIAEDEAGYIKLGDLPVIIDDKLAFTSEEFSFDKKVKFTLLDIITCIFDELIHEIREGKNVEA